jgi:hypothetical protein
VTHAGQSAVAVVHLIQNERERGKEEEEEDEGDLV